MAAGTLLVQEAGGTTSGMQGEPLDLNGRYVLADNGLVHEEMLGIFDEIFLGRYQYEMPPLPSPEWELQGG
jgi:myo-inositol-1(or 4)-monophosphatase